jgi:hypothetical protein
MRVEGQAPVRPACPHCTRTQISGTISCEFALRYSATLLHNVRQLVVEGWLLTFLRKTPLPPTALPPFADTRVAPL